jgi:hypothetical protein
MLLTLLCIPLKLGVFFTEQTIIRHIKGPARQVFLLVTIKQKSTAPEIHLRVYNYKELSYCGNCIGGVMVSVFVSSAIDRGFVPRPGQTKEYKIGVLLLLR